LGCISDKLSIIEINEDSILKNGILKMHKNNSGMNEDMRIILYDNFIFEIFEVNSNSKLDSLELTRNFSLKIKDKNKFELISKENDNYCFSHEEEMEIKSWVELINKCLQKSNLQLDSFSFR